jgi:hypothetical protein
MSRNRSLFFILAIFSGVASSACSYYVDSDRVQCKSKPDCDAIGYVGYLCVDSMCKAPVDETWACLDGASTSEPATGSVRVSITLVDLLSQKPLSGVVLSLCAKLDGTCMFPILPQYQSNSAGQLDVEMPAGFDGYFQADGAGIYPTLIFPPSTRKQRAPSSIPLVPASFYPTMVRGSGTTVADDRSVVLTTALDCVGRPAAGLLLSSPQADSQTISYVLAGGMPSRTTSVTDESGGGGFVNVPAGGVLINSTLAASNRPVGTAGVQTRPGHVSMVLIMPNGS